MCLEAVPAKSKRATHMLCPGADDADDQTLGSHTHGWSPEAPMGQWQLREEGFGMRFRQRSLRWVLI